MAKQPNWTNEEIEKFKELYPKINQEELSKIFKRSVGVLETKSNRLGLKKEVNIVGKRIFLQQEIDIIVEMARDNSIVDIGKKINRSKESLYDLFSKLNIISVPAKFWWTKDEVDFLIENYQILSENILTEKLNKSWGAIKRRAQKLKLFRFKKGGEVYKVQKKITKKEEKFILENYDKMNVTKIAKELGRSDILVINFCAKNNLQLLKLRNNPKDFSDKFLLDSLLEMAKKLQRCPTSEEIQNNIKLPSIDIYYDRFKTFFNACELAGLIPNIGTYGTLCYSKNNDRCLSIKEQTITNFFIDNNIKYDKEKYYNSIVLNLKEKIRMDWYLLDFDIVVEYFGLNNKTYNEKTNKKIKYL